MKTPIPLVAAFIVLAPGIALAQGEAAEMRQIYQACINSGGRAASNYNAWVAQNGCICPGSSTGSGARTCSGASASSAGTGSSGNLATDSTKNVVQGMMNGNSQQMGIGLMGIGAAALIQGMQSDPAANARRAQEAALAAEQQRLAEERRRAEELRQQELTKQRILGSLKGTERGDPLSLKTDESSGPAAGSTIGLLKLGEPADTAAPKTQSAGFNKGFEASSQCYSQNAGPYCTGVAADRQQACVADYRAGYEAGDKQRQQAMDVAYQVGKGAGAAGGLADGASDPRALGPCRVQWIETYNRGYFESKNAAAQR